MATRITRATSGSVITNITVINAGCACIGGTIVIEHSSSTIFYTGGFISGISSIAVTTSTFTTLRRQ